MFKTLVISAGAVFALAAPVLANGTSGLWLTEKEKVAVSLSPCSGDADEMCGQISWLKNPYDKAGGLKRDVENDDPALRDEPWCGLTVITGLTEKKPGLWTGGTFYYPKDGRKYDLEVEETETGLKVHAFLGVKLLGKTERWRRVDSDLPACPTG